MRSSCSIPATAATGKTVTGIAAEPATRAKQPTTLTTKTTHKGRRTAVETAPELRTRRQPRRQAAATAVPTGPRRRARLRPPSGLAAATGPWPDRKRAPAARARRRGAATAVATGPRRRPRLRPPPGLGVRGVALAPRR